MNERTASVYENNSKPLVERLVTWLGSFPSLVLHTIIFLLFFTTGFLHLFPWDMILLVFTTIVSIEAIYLSLFIQMTVNQQAKSLKEVEEDVEDIQENIEDIQEDVEEISEDVEDITEDDEKDEERKKFQVVTLETLSRDIQQIVAHLEILQKK